VKKTARPPLPPRRAVAKKADGLEVEQ